MGGEIEENTQEGENKACSLVKEAVLRQILRHTLTVHEAEMTAVITLAEEQLDTLQASLEPVTAGEDRQPLRRALPQNSTSTEGGNAENIAQGHPTTPCSPHRHPHGSMTTNGSAGGEEAWHVTQFIRRYGLGDGLRIASSVLYATIGVIETQMGRNNETILVRAIAGEIHRIARHLLCHQQHLQEEGELLHRGTKRLSAEEVVQWEQQVREEEQEVEETAMTLEETGGEDMPESDAHSPTSTANSHRRRRMLAMHHKEFIGEDGGGTDDEHCLMAMERYASSSSSQNGEPPEETTRTGRGGGNQRHYGENGGNGVGIKRRTPTWTRSYARGWWKAGYCRTRRLLHRWGSVVMLSWRYSDSSPPISAGCEQTARSGDQYKAWYMTFRWR